MKILVTGFEPFGGSPINPSEQLVRSLTEQPPAGVSLVTALLPVDREAGPRALLAALDAAQPDAVVCFGQASRRAALSLERVAVNLLDYGLPDNAGRMVVDEPVAADGPAAYFATLPVRALLEALLSAGLPAELSLSAGTFLCNQVLYTLLHHLHPRGRVVPAGFVHVPALPEQAAAQAQRDRGPLMPSMSVETLRRAAVVILETLAGARGW